MGKIGDEDDDHSDIDVIDDTDDHSYTETNQSKQLSELLYCVNSLGTYNVNNDIHSTLFSISQYAVNGLIGIETMLKHDIPETQLTHYYCGQWHVVRTHLLPLLIQAYYTLQYNTVNNIDNDTINYSKIILLVVKILVRLTLPVNTQILDNHQQRIIQQQQLKGYILDNNYDICSILCDYMNDYITQYLMYVQTYNEVNSDTGDKNMVELYYTLYKNLLLITDPVDAGTELSRAQHDRFILKLYSSYVIESAVLISQHLHVLRDTQISMLMLDFFVTLYRKEFSDELYSNSDIKIESNSDKPLTSQQLEKAQQAQQLQQLIQRDKTKFKDSSNIRHGRFTAKLEIKSKIQNNQIDSMRHYASLDTTDTYITDLLPHQQGKKPIPEPTKRVYLNFNVKAALLSTMSMLLAKPVVDTDDNTTSRIKLVNAFTGISTTVYQYIKNTATTDMTLQNTDCDKYLQFISLCIGCYRHNEYSQIQQGKTCNDISTLYDFRCIRNVITLDTMKYCISRIKQAYEEKPIQHNSIALAATVYCEIIVLLSHCTQYSNLAYKHESEMIARSILHEQEYTNILPELIKSYVQYQYTRKYLSKLIVAANAMIGMLQQFAVTNFKQIAKKRKQTKKIEYIDDTEETEMTDEKAKTTENTDQTGTDSTNDTNNNTIDTKDTTEQNTSIINESQQPLSTDELYAKLLGSDTDELMNQNVDDMFAEVEREMQAVVQQDTVIHNDTVAHTDNVVHNDTAITADSSETTDKSGDTNTESSETTEVESKQITNNTTVSNELYDDTTVERHEVDFNFEKFIVKFAHPNIIQHYTHILSYYNTNTQELNMCIVDLFLRLTIERNLYTMFYQLYIFIIFQQILQPHNNRQQYTILRKMCRLILKQFFTQLQTNKVLLIEILFWKGLQTADNLLSGGTKYTDTFSRMYTAEQKRRAAETGEILSDSESETEMKPNQVKLRPEQELFAADDDYILATNYELYKDSDVCMTVLSSMLSEAHSDAAIELQLIRLGLIDTTTYTLKHQVKASSAEKVKKHKKSKEKKKRHSVHAVDAQYDMDVANGLERSDSFIDNSDLYTQPKHIESQGSINDTPVYNSVTNDRLDVKQLKKPIKQLLNQLSTATSSVFVQWLATHIHNAVKQRRDNDTIEQYNLTIDDTVNIDHLQSEEYKNLMQLLHFDTAEASLYSIPITVTSRDLYELTRIIDTALESSRINERRSSVISNDVRRSSVISTNIHVDEVDKENMYTDNIDTTLSPAVQPKKKRLRKPERIDDTVDDAGIDTTTIPVDTVQPSPDNAKRRRTVIQAHDDEEMDFEHSDDTVEFVLSDEDKQVMVYIEQILKSSSDATMKILRKQLSKQHGVDTKTDKARIKKLMTMVASNLANTT